MKHDLPRIAISLGDPAGIGPEITARAIDALASRRPCEFVLVGDAGAWKSCERLLGMALTTSTTRDERRLRGGCAVLDVSPRGAGRRSAIPMGRASAVGGRSAHAAVLRSIELVRSGRVDALVTAPLSKESLALAGLPLTGHTEILEQRCAVPRAVLTLCAGRVRITFATNHIAIADVRRRLTRRQLRSTIEITARGVREYFGVRRAPRIAVCGLNPHAGEGGQLGDEEARIITPEIEAARVAGIDCHGPVAADALFASSTQRRAYDAIVAMYHDQGAIPAKMLSRGRGFNVTFGLPIVRTSPDHGTAFDIAGRGVASSRPMQSAIHAALDISRRLNATPERAQG